MIEIKSIDKRIEERDRIIKYLKEEIETLKENLRCGVSEDSVYKLEKEEVQNKLDILNTIEINETDWDGEGLIYMMIDNTVENRNKLHAIGFTDEDIAESCGLNNIDELDPDEDIDICMLAFKYADYYSKGKFILAEDIEVDD